jgi:hypothetical protein
LNARCVSASARSSAQTRLVTFLGAIILGGLIWAALHLTLAPTQMRVAAGPPGSADVKFVEMLSGKFAAQHAKVQFHLVATDGPRASAAALAAGEADLAVLPSTLADAPDWPVVAILRKNVMALVVPTQPPPAPAKNETPPPAKEASAAEGKDKAAKPEKGADKSKSARPIRAAKARATRAATKLTKATRPPRPPPRTMKRPLKKAPTRALRRTPTRQPPRSPRPRRSISRPTRKPTRRRTRMPTTATRPTRTTKPAPRAPMRTSSIVSPSSPATASASLPATRRPRKSWAWYSPTMAFCSIGCRFR